MHFNLFRVPSRQDYLLISELCTRLILLYDWTRSLLLISLVKLLGACLLNPLDPVLNTEFVSSSNFLRIPIIEIRVLRLLFIWACDYSALA